MKTTSSVMARVLTLALLVSGLAAVPALSADEHEKAESAEQTAKIEIPKTLPALWSAVTEHQQELHQTLAAKKLADVHHHAFAVRDLVAAMPAKSGKLEPAKDSALTKSVSRVASLAGLLDEAGDSNDSAKVLILITKLDAELKTIAALYPAKDLIAPPKAAEVVKPTYFCPMHPDVVSDKPGACPKCGMKLTLKAAPAESAHDHH